MPVRYPSIAWLVLGVIASAAWFVTATRLMRLWGLNDAAPALGLLAAAVVALTLWRWAAADRRGMALAALRCPRCDQPLRTEHSHARPRGVATGIQRWHCGLCQYEHSEALTCPQCAA
ncbi:MAG: hypothetical protein QF664_03590 [Dehalococcoidia bacterium]|jgi:hypothetical protein|nr:hypothetical protein [Dehalococcoidia bacterium]